MIIGAGIGAAGGFGGGFLALLTQTKNIKAQHDAERARWLADVRRETYTAFVTATKDLSKALWRASDQLHDTDAGTSDWQAAFREVHDAWTVFSAASAAVTMSGPHPVAERADDLRHAMRYWEMLTGAWINAAISHGDGRTPEYHDRFTDAATAKRPKEAAFQSAARKALGTE
ncbi:hypothetical protein [Streptomyces sp. YIM 130001]|uniref:hypothetical protein n=1 Tax=Streptomyces sp. YIM 130001 TaxID=2259644 RepID=UPI0013C48311|nr:hypothetical protein [Streptomyces sp. YIM 130001]